MKRIALSQIERFGRSEMRGSYCIFLKPTFSEEQKRSDGVVHQITRNQADALHTFLKALNDPDIVVKFPEWRTLTLGDIQISTTGDVNQMVSTMKEQHITVDNYRAWARDIMCQSLDENFPRVVQTRKGAFLSTEGEWTLVPRANDFVLAYLRQEFSDVEVPSGVAAVAGKLRKIVKAELIKDGGLFLESDGLHAQLGPVTSGELLYIAECLLPRK